MVKNKERKYKTTYENARNARNVAATAEKKKKKNNTVFQFRFAEVKIIILNTIMARNKVRSKTVITEFPATFFFPPF